MKASARIHTEDPLHQQDLRCICRDCGRDRMGRCQQPHTCAQEALDRLNAIAPKLNPLRENWHGDLSLTRRRLAWNEMVRANQEEIVFDPSMTSKNNLAECFRIFTNPKRISGIPVERLQGKGVAIRQEELTIYTDGACHNNGKANTRSGSGIWLEPNHAWNKAISIPGKAQSNQIGEIVVVIEAVSSVPLSWPLKILTDSMYVIEGLTTHLSEWEDKGWIGIKKC
jgi:hypothetical protein